MAIELERFEIVGIVRSRREGFKEEEIYTRGENPGGRVIDGLTGKETIIKISSVRPAVIVNVLPTDPAKINHQVDGSVNLDTS
jgi:hypothetical protein